MRQPEKFLGAIIYTLGVKKYSDLKGFARRLWVAQFDVDFAEKIERRQSCYCGFRGRLKDVEGPSCCDKSLFWLRCLEEDSGLCEELFG